MGPIAQLNKTMD